MPSFLMPAGLTVEDLADRLAPVGRLEAGRPRLGERTLLDTFDWRLYRSGWTLESTPGRGAALYLRPLGGGRPLCRTAGPVVRFAHELPEGALRGRIAPVTEPRALLAIACLEVAETPLRLRTGTGRPGALLLFETLRVGPPGTSPTLPLRPVLTLPPGPGAAAVAALCAAWPDCDPAPPDRVAFALEPLGRTPGDYSGKLRVPLAGSLPARDALRTLLLHLLGTLEANLLGVRANLDPEFLHDLRVAVRRTRSALGQIKGVLPPAVTARFSREFGWLQQASGPARDLDVYVLELPALGALLPARPRRSLGPLARLLERRRREAYVALARELDTPRFSRLLADWRAFLLRPTPQRPTGAVNARVPCADVAARRIARLHRRALREGGAIRAASPAADLHELRKTCKKLRYLVEFFQSLAPRETADAAIAALKGLQDTLGRHQDLQVQADALAGYARELAREGAAPPPAYVALGMLIERLREQQQQARREFAERFGQLSHKSGRRVWKKLIAATAAARATAAHDTEPRDGEG